MRTRQMGEPPPGAPLEPGQAVWAFLQHQNGVVFLATINGGVPVPMIAFLTPAALLDFEEDVYNAVERFVPLSVKQAEEIVRKGWDVDARCEAGEPGTRDKPIEPPSPPSGEAPPS